MSPKSLVLTALAAFLLPIPALCQLTPDAAARELAEHEVAVRPDYVRHEWGRWAPTEHRGLNDCRWDTRHWLLRSVGMETNPGTFTTREEAGKSCRVMSMTIVDRYTGERFTGPANKVDIDHIVPLAEAHRSGGWRWDKATRLAFWNDPLNHVAVMEGTNARKSDIDPGGQSQRGQRARGWLPPDDSQWCWYGTTWLEVKAKWGLTIDPKEAEALGISLAACFSQDPDALESMSRTAAKEAAAQLLEVWSGQLQQLMDDIGLKDQ